MNNKKDILLTAINAKWIHPSLALRLLKANLDSLEDSCEIIEFALRQPLAEKLEPLLAARPRILGISVSVWNHSAALELLEELDKIWTELSLSERFIKPVVVLGGPEVSHLPQDAKIFQYADFIIRGEGETAFRVLCEDILKGGNKMFGDRPEKLIACEPGNLSKIKTAYHLYTDEDINKKLIYVESSRGCVFNCEFCLSAVADNKVRQFPLDQFLAEMDILIKRGVKTFKFLDRSFNINIPRALRIIEFFLDKIFQKNQSSLRSNPFVVHFEMVPSIFPQELLDALASFPPETLRLEIGIQTLNPEAAARISRLSNPEKELQTLRFLREKTNAIIHADLIAGLPGEDIESFGRGFDLLWEVLAPDENESGHPRFEIQLGILKQLPGAPISRLNETFGMRYNPLPPYEIEETAAISAENLRRIKNFARFWELIVNRGLKTFSKKPVFGNFLILSDKLFAHFGRNWGIDKYELTSIAGKLCFWDNL
ncbi:MAG: B12-binding domain-containing radical SAM protein [Treponema sp.]|nr:B12-binding domain-containing radical SAM protein [Treponema sp.]